MACWLETQEDGLSRPSEKAAGYKSKEECGDWEDVSMFQCFTANHASWISLPWQLSFGRHFERWFINAVHLFNPNHSSWIGLLWQQSFGGHFKRRFTNAVHLFNTIYSFVMDQSPRATVFRRALREAVNQCRSPF